MLIRKNILSLVMVSMLLLTGILIFVGCSAEVDDKKEEVELAGADIVVPGDYESIQDAIDSADNNDVIEVEPGTYEENIDFGGKDIKLRSTNPYDDEIVKDTIIDGSGNGAVVAFQNQEQEAVIKGFTIKEGSGETIEPVGSEIIAGGGIFVYDGASPTISNNIISENSSQFGAGIYVGDSQVDIKDNMISNNQADDVGGAISAGVGSEVFVDNNIIEENSAEEWAGGISVSDSNAVIKNNNINENSINATRLGGGGVTVTNSDIELENNDIYKNSSDYKGGGVLVASSDALINENTIDENTAEHDGGALAVSGSNVTLKNNNLNENSSKRRGGGIYVYGQSNISLEDNVINNNKAGAGFDGGGIYVQDSEVILETNTIDDNEPDNVYEE
ncbi:right-handed parallel beta-helix repeat-containing protein [Natranaerofaba carboxydovora]|uniref:right-handed parallel beta-helix repeat-containing protein n=1 Tax=Natranaerofaba carboxydovora TaxID=2742683 RepID=UPI001F1479A1|nr:right-handed parallel beta-helix repeat-containing protein [Natranaerofaba carboxydovora]UMZ74400.1 Right handed beta helix region [Natranaerofaba carboxydovora]